MEANVTRILDLPSGPLNVIYQMLESNFEREAFGLTCHQLLKIQDCNLKFLDIGCSPMNRGHALSKTKEMESTTIEKMLNRFRLLESLVLRGRIVKVQDSALTPLSDYGTTLKRVCLDGCKSITDVGISHISLGCPSLSSISLSSCTITDDGLRMLANSCKNLKEVNVSKCIGITDSGICELLKCCRDMSMVDISRCTKITGKGFLECSYSLHHLEASECAFDKRGMEGILSGGGLQVLKISGLKFSNWGNGFECFTFGTCANIGVVDLSFCWFLSDGDIECISKGCPKLHRVLLSGCWKIGFTGWDAIATNCKKLDILHAQGCRNLCDKSLMALGIGCRSLSVIYLDSCTATTQAGIRNFKWVRENVQIRRDNFWQGPTMATHLLDMLNLE